MTQTTNNQPHTDDELLTEILSDLIYDTTNSYGWPPDYEPDFDKAKQQILKHFVPKEEVEAMKRELMSAWRCAHLARVSGTEQEIAEYEAEAARVEAKCLGCKMGVQDRELTNNQPNTPKGEGE